MVGNLAVGVEFQKMIPRLTQGPNAGENGGFRPHLVGSSKRLNRAAGRDACNRSIPGYQTGKIKGRTGITDSPWVTKFNSGRVPGLPDLHARLLRTEHPVAVL